MNTAPLKAIFAGTPAFAASHLHALLDLKQKGKLEIQAVLTQPDRRAGRGKALTPSPVKTLALEHGLDVMQPPGLRDNPDAIRALKELQPDVIIVVAYGLLLPGEVLDMPEFGCINVHASLLPRWRGAAPIEWAILSGDAKTGVAIMQMDRGLDTGPVITARETPISEDDNSATVSARLEKLGSEALADTLLSLKQGPLNPQPQDDAHATYARKLTRSDAAIDWHQPANLVARTVQAFYPRSPAYTFINGDRLMILDAVPGHESVSARPGTILAADKGGLTAACQDTTLVIRRVQLAGKKPQTAGELLNGRKEQFLPGKVFENTISGA